MFAKNRNRCPCIIICTQITRATKYETYIQNLTRPPPPLGPHRRHTILQGILRPYTVIAHLWSESPWFYATERSRTLAASLASSLARQIFWRVPKFSDLRENNGLHHAWRWADFKLIALHKSHLKLSAPVHSWPSRKVQLKTSRFNKKKGPCSTSWCSVIAL